MVLIDGKLVRIECLNVFNDFVCLIRVLVFVCILVNILESFLYGVLDFGVGDEGFLIFRSFSSWISMGCIVVVVFEDLLWFIWIFIFLNYDIIIIDVICLKNKDIILVS